jgi:hypothetical protein
MDRRDFLQGAGAAGMTALSASRILGANDRINIGLIGCAGRGRYVARLMHDSSANVAYTAVADVYDKNAGIACEWTAHSFKDFRRLLDLKDIDTLHIATLDPLACHRHRARLRRRTFRRSPR